MGQHLRRQLRGRAIDLQAGEYRRAKGGDGRPTAICCPSCGHRASLGDKHDIDRTGRVTPSYGCPKKGCGFHEWIILDDYWL